jgi:hypothetical protein
MTDTDPQREGETLQREYPDPSVLGGGRPWRKWTAREPPVDRNFPGGGISTRGFLRPLSYPLP